MFHLKKENVCSFEVEDQSNKEFCGCKWKHDSAKLVAFNYNGPAGAF
jgi:hypothetical protein